MGIKSRARNMLRSRRRRDVEIAVIIAVAIIDAILLGFLHARYISESGFDIRPRHPAVAKPAPP